MQISPRPMLALCTVLAAFAIAGPSTAEVPHVKIGRFPQEVATVYTVDDGLPSNHVKGVCLDRSNTVWAETDQGWAVRQGGARAAAEAPAKQKLPRFIDPQEYATINGKVLSVENRFFCRWNKSPWTLDYPGDGRQLASGTAFLLPYYMGLYHGFIQETE